MTLVWHILRKDLRHTWVYAAVALGLLLVSAWNLWRVLTASRSMLTAALTVQQPVDTLLFVSWGLLCGVLVLTETIPGVRQHWLARPIRWQNLIGAKALSIGLIAVVPLAGLHLALVALRGFPVWEHFGVVVWNALSLVLICVLPVAVMASISRNLQELVLWVLGVGTVVASLRIFVPGAPFELSWVVDGVTVAAGVIGGLAIVAWQYSARRTGAGRIAVIGLVAVIASLHYWPAGVWYAARRAASPMAVSPETARLTVDADQIEWLSSRWARNRGLTWDGGGRLMIPYKAVDLPAGWTSEINDWRVVGAGAATGDELEIRGAIRSPYESQLLKITQVENGGTISLESKSDVLERNAGAPIDINIVAELTIFGPPGKHSLPVNGEAFVPGVGRCRSDARDTLIIDCQSVLRTRNLIVGFWGKAPVLSQREDTSLLPATHPITLLGGGIAASSNYENNEIVFEARKPVAYLQRRIELRRIRMADYER